MNFNEPYHIIDEVERLVKDPLSGLCATSKLLDCGAGTGLIGLKISEKGLNSLKMTGIDASSSFAEVLQSSSQYEAAHELWLGRGVENFPMEFKDQFEIVTASGVFLKGHMPASAMDDCHAALKINGYFVTAMRSCYWQNGNEEGFREKLDELVSAGKFRLVNTYTFVRGIEGEIGLFARQESRLVCYKKTE